MIIRVCFVFRKTNLFIGEFLFLDAASVSSNNSNETSSDFTEPQHSPLASTASLSSTTSSTSTVSDIIDNILNYTITTEINDSGKKKYFLF
jgi:hypothetical protein